ncbi:MAG: hypothetical protein IJ678_07570, partial [Kiritimatiellae bacterium]|nr:hypothetical protein [Kiritimatiellia bacterium]
MKNGINAGRFAAFACAVAAVAVAAAASLASKNRSLRESLSLAETRIAAFEAAMRTAVPAPAPAAPAAERAPAAEPEPASAAAEPAESAGDAVAFDREAFDKAV